MELSTPTAASSVHLGPLVLLEDFNSHVEKIGSLSTPLAVEVSPEQDKHSPAHPKWSIMHFSLEALKLKLLVKALVADFLLLFS